MVLMEDESSLLLLLLSAALPSLGAEEALLSAAREFRLFTDEEEDFLAVEEEDPLRDECRWLAEAMTEPEELGAPLAEAPLLAEEDEEGSPPRLETSTSEAMRLNVFVRSYNDKTIIQSLRKGQYKALLLTFTLIFSFSFLILSSSSSSRRLLSLASSWSSESPGGVEPEALEDLEEPEPPPPSDPGELSSLRRGCCCCCELGGSPEYEERAELGASEPE